VEGCGSCKEAYLQGYGNESCLGESPAGGLIYQNPIGGRRLKTSSHPPLIGETGDKKESAAAKKRHYIVTGEKTWENSRLKREVGNRPGRKDLSKRQSASE